MMSEHVKRSIQSLRDKYPKDQPRALLLPALWLVQRERGFIDESSAADIAEELSIPLIWVREAISWYTMFHAAPIGKHHLQVCRNLSCALMGSEDLVRELKDILHIKVGETSSDGQFTLETVECLGSCGTAPVMRVDEEYHECLNHEKLASLIEKLKQK
jgi:NADH-quinone oxidoreductase subunit E